MIVTLTRISFRCNTWDFDLPCSRCSFWIFLFFKM